VTRAITTVLVCVLLLPGCLRKYTNPQLFALETFDMRFGCTAADAKPDQTGWLVQGCGFVANCDVYSGEWRCDKSEAAYVRAWRSVAGDHPDCPRERVIATREAQPSNGVVVVNIEACGKPYVCEVTGAAVCHPGAAVVSAPAPTKACVPACRAGFVCADGRCVSACNPPCGNNETCGRDGECHPR
jgi:hypothetical protein